MRLNMESKFFHREKPGWDIFTAEFYSTSKEDFRPVLINLFLKIQSENFQTKTQDLLLKTMELGKDTKSSGASPEYQQR